MKKIYTLLVLALPVFLVSNAMAVQPGSYDFKNETAYILVGKEYGMKYSEEGAVLYVDFKNKTTNVIAKGKRLKRISLNHDKTILSYMDAEKLYFYDLVNKETIKTYPQPYQQTVWASDRNMIAVYDTTKNQLLEIWLEEAVVKKAEMPGKGFWGIQWNTGCKCFLYEVSKDYDTEHYVVRFTAESKLTNTKHIKTIATSPNKKYYFKQIYFGDGFDDIKLLDNVTGDIISEYNANSSLYTYNYMWTENTLRLLGNGALIDLDNGTLITATYNLWKSNTKRPRWRLTSLDMAADRDGYILIWNYINNRFDVEDINTGKIIRTYEKFW